MSKWRASVPVLFFVLAFGLSGCGDSSQPVDDVSENGSDLVVTDSTQTDHAGVKDVVVDTENRDLTGQDTTETNDVGPDQSAGLDSGSENEVCIPDVADVPEVQPDTGSVTVPEVGDKVPDFTLDAHDRSSFTLSDNLGHYVVISSFPIAGTSVCEWQNNYIRDHIQDFESVDAIPVGLSTDTMSTLSTWAAEKEYTHLLLADDSPHGEVSRSLGVFSVLNYVSSRALLVVDPAGTLIYKVVYGMGSKPDFETMLSFIETHAAGE